MNAKRAFAVLPGVGASLLPKLACPMCWPAYAGLLTTLGLGFLISERYLLAFTAGLLLVSVAALAFRARERRGYGPALLGLVSAAAVLAGKFYLDSNALAYSGIALLLGSSLWNSWPRRAAGTPCPGCAPSDAELITRIQSSVSEKSS